MGRPFFYRINVCFRPIANIRDLADAPPVTDAITITFSAALVAALQTSSPDADEQKENVFIVSVAARPDECNLSLATKVDLLTLTGRPEGWAGKCVAVDGYWQSRALFAVRADARKRYAQSKKAVRNRRVGIYGTDALLTSAPDAPLPYTAVGVAGQCDALRAKAEIVMGYCHYTSGAYIAVSEMRRR